jgi:hypothetical protein
MLLKMSGGNFNWFLHIILFMHSLNIIQKQEDQGSDDAEVNVEHEE